MRTRDEFNADCVIAILSNPSFKMMTSEELYDYVNAISGKVYGDDFRRRNKTHEDPRDKMKIAELCRIMCLRTDSKGEKNTIGIVKRVLTLAGIETYGQMLAERIETEEDLRGLMRGVGHVNEPVCSTKKLTFFIKAAEDYFDMKS